MEGRVTDTMIKPVRWMTQQAATGLKDLPRNSAWLLSKAVTAPSAKMRAAGDGITDSIHTLSVAAADQFPEARDTVEVRLKRAEAAIASAKQAANDAKRVMTKPPPASNCSHRASTRDPHLAEFPRLHDASGCHGGHGGIEGRPHAASPAEATARCGVCQSGSRATSASRIADTPGDRFPGVPRRSGPCDDRVR